MFGVIAKFKRQGLAFGIPGLILQIGCRMFFKIGMAQDHSSAEWFLTLAWCEIGSWIGTVLLIVGFYYYAKSKGRTPLWGLAAFISCIGLVILYFLEDLVVVQLGFSR
jgi:hypothetical protein